MYKKGGCTCKVLVLLIKPIVFLTFSSPSASLDLKVPIVLGTITSVIQEIMMMHEKIIGSAIMKSFKFSCCYFSRSMTVWHRLRMQFFFSKSLLQGVKRQHNIFTRSGPRPFLVTTGFAAFRIRSF